MDFQMFLIIIVIILNSQECRTAEAQGGTYPNVIRFPFGGPFMGLFLAIAIPLELPHNNVFLSYNFEANYNLPQNDTTYDYPPIISDRSLGISRKNAYAALEFKLKSHGYPGKYCLLRTICEAAEYTTEINGVLGDLLHILLTPSTSKNNNLSPEYENAEAYGKLKGHCRKFNRKCPISLLGLISWLDRII